jgi:CHASE2 domain-containing sensor protein/class 3 adenylate cyclase
MVSAPNVPQKRVLQKIGSVKEILNFLGRFTDFRTVSGNIELYGSRCFQPLTRFTRRPVRWQLPDQLRQFWQSLPSSLRAGVPMVALISLASSGIIIVASQAGWLQGLELRLYDRLVRISTRASLDDRLLVVEITEEDIRRLDMATPSDAMLAQVLTTLEQYEPQVIGLDLHRDVGQGEGREALLEVLQNDSIIVITKLGDSEADNIPPPPGIPEEQVGFNDLLIDPDGIVRRNLIFGGPYYSFSLRLALHYLAEQGIEPVSSEINESYMQLGETTFVPLRSDDGGYQTVDDRGYQILLDYRAPRQVARRVNFSEVLDNRVNPEWVRDRIVLIGTTAPSGKDLFYTPFSAGEAVDHQMAGVELHAQFVSQLLDAALGERSLIRFWPNPVEWIWIVAWALVAGSVTWWLRHPLALILGSGVVLMLLTGSSYVLLTQQVWVPLAAPILATLLSTGSVVAFQAQQAQRQQQMVMTLLGQNTSPEIAEALWRNRDRLLQSGKLPGQQLTATMLFTDIRGFSTISERMSPESLLEWLNEYLEEMTQVICEYHGIVNKFTGDGLLAVFGVPMPRHSEAEIAQDACNAVACALAMGDRLQQLNGKWQAHGFKPLQMRIGIFTGPIVAGSLGGKRRMEYGVIGDSVNIASRLESCAKERQVGICRILIAEETLNYIDDKFQVEPWGQMELRGRQQLVQVYRVVALIPSQSSGLAEGVPADKFAEQDLLQQKKQISPGTKSNFFESLFSNMKRRT